MKLFFKFISAVQTFSSAAELPNWSSVDVNSKGCKMDFSTPSFNPGLFNSRLFNHELFNPRLFNHEFFNHGVEKFMFENSGVEKSRVEMSLNLLER